LKPKLKFKVLQKKIFTYLVVFLLLNSMLFAQKRKPIEYSGFFDTYYYRGPFSVSAGMNLAGYIGDLGFMPGVSLSPGYHLGFNYKTWPKTYFGGEFNNYSLSGGVTSDSTRKINFNTKVYELIGYMRFNLIDKKILFKNDINKRPQRVRPYLTIGFGAIYYDPKATIAGDTLFLKKYEGIQSSTISMVAPVSLGFSFYLNKRFSVLTEFGYRYALTDALESLNKVNTTGFDSYATASLKLQYNFLAFKKRKAKYMPSQNENRAPSASPVEKAPAKDTTLNEPILPPGESTPKIEPKPVPEPPQEFAPEPVQDVKKLTDEEKKKLKGMKEHLKEQPKWQDNTKPAETSPANKKKEPPQPSGW
jgi:hypothetical protein